MLFSTSNRSLNASCLKNNKHETARSLYSDMGYFCHVSFICLQKYFVYYAEQINNYTIMIFLLNPVQ